jgi:hypothetical protein
LPALSVLKQDVHFAAVAGGDSGVGAGADQIEDVRDLVLGLKTGDVHDGVFLEVGSGERVRRCWR